MHVHSCPTASFAGPVGGRACVWFSCSWPGVAAEVVLPRLPTYRLRRRNRPHHPTGTGEIVVPEVTDSERRPGGDASTTLANDEAFWAKSLTPSRRTSAPTRASSPATQIFRNDHEGEGPLLNARTCQGCHTKDGRGALPQDTDTPMDAMSIALSVGVEDDGSPVPDPSYGTLLHTFGLASFGGAGLEAGLPRFGGGETATDRGRVRLRRVRDRHRQLCRRRELRTASSRLCASRTLSYGDFGDDIRFSARVAPQLVGVGLLGAVPEAVIRERADPDDADDDGI